MVTAKSENAPDRVKAKTRERVSQVFEELCTVDVREMGSGQI